MGLGSRIRKKTHSGSRIQGSKRHRIPDPDPQHWFLHLYSFTFSIYNSKYDLKHFNIGAKNVWKVGDKNQKNIPSLPTSWLLYADPYCQCGPGSIGAKPLRILNAHENSRHLWIFPSKAVNRGDKRSRRYRYRDFAKFERSRRYRDRYRCQEKKSRRGRDRYLVFRDPPLPRTRARSLIANR